MREVVVAYVKVLSHNPPGGTAVELHPLQMFAFSLERTDLNTFRSKLVIDESRTTWLLSCFRTTNKCLRIT
jgi:hypothetical protein